MNRIRLDEVKFSYGAGRQVLRGVTLDVPAGQVVGLLGANGAGKTTTFKILAGLLRADSGTVTIDGVAAAAEPLEARQRTAFVPDTPLLYDQMSAQENLNMFALLWNVDAAAAKARSAQLLREAGLWSVRDEWVRGYSAGMKQKLSLCAALLHDPRVMVLDEPFSGLDVEGALWGREVIRAQARAGKAILFSSHVPELVEAIADSVAILDRGIIVNTAAIADVKRAGGAVRHFTSHASKAS
jgi:ABC-2 type transport system ATP-binding protein